MSKSVRFAVVGLDHWYSAIDFAERLTKTDGAELVGIADRNEAHAREVAEKCGIDSFTTDLEHYLADDGVDAVALYASVDQNPELAIKAANAGKHIVSIKPLANTLEDATRIVEAVRAAGVVFIPSESRFRVTGVTEQMKDIVDSGKLGDVASGSFLQTGGGLPTSWPTSGVSGDGGWWVEEGKAPGGGWVDHSIYQIDRLRYVLGQEIVRVSGRMGNFLHKDIPFEDFGHGIVEFENGALIAIEDTWSGPQGAWRNVSTIQGTVGVYDSDTLRGNVKLYTVDSGWEQIESMDDDLGVIEPILDAINGVTEPFATVEDGWANLAVCLAFYESAESGRTIDVPSLDDYLTS